MVVLTSFTQPTDGIRHRQNNTTVYVNDNNLGKGTLYIAESRLSWVSDSGNGFSIEYPHISLHAVSRDLTAFPQECLFLMLDTAVGDEETNSGDGENDDGNENGSDEETTEIRLVPDDRGMLEAMFHAMNACQALHPDPEDSFSDEDFYEDADDEIPMEEADHRMAGLRIESTDGRAHIGRRVDFEEDMEEDMEEDISYTLADMRAAAVGTLVGRVGGGMAVGMAGDTAYTSAHRVEDRVGDMAGGRGAGRVGTLVGGMAGDREAGRAAGRVGTLAGDMVVGRAGDTVAGRAGDTVTGRAEAGTNYTLGGMAEDSAGTNCTLGERGRGRGDRSSSSGSMRHQDRTAPSLVAYSPHMDLEKCNFDDAEN